MVSGDNGALTVAVACAKKLSVISELIFTLHPSQQHCPCPTSLNVMLGPVDEMEE